MLFLYVVFLSISNTNSISQILVLSWNYYAKKMYNRKSNESRDFRMESRSPTAE